VSDPLPTDAATALRIAENFVHHLSVKAGIEMTVTIAHTIERDFGYVFFYSPVDCSVLVAGNAPIIVDRTVGQCTKLEPHIRARCTWRTTLGSGVAADRACIDWR
jgi:hypothetical protein